MIHVIFPTYMEAKPFVAHLEGAGESPAFGCPGWKGEISGSRVTALVCGIGQANAARVVTAILSGSESGPIVLGGCAGAYEGSGLSVGDVAVATEEVYAGLGIESPDGFITLKQAGLSLVETGGERYYETIPLQAVVTLDMAKVSDGLPRVVSGRFLTVTTVTGTKAAGARLFAQYGALCENMEGAAAAQVALVYGAPFVEVRGISNMVVDRDREGWDIPLAAEMCAVAVKNVINGWGR